ncbi:MAG: hypothetical protein ABEI58_01010 [Candidatus Nanohaloarchaea archaeon]
MRKDFIHDLYQEVREIGNSVLELPEEEMEHRLEHEFGFGLPENNYHVSSGNDFQRASFGISYLLADSYAESDQSLFYSERADDFQEFIEELGGHSSGYNTDHLIQYHSLYRSIAEEEGLDVSRYPGDNLVLQRKEDIAEEVLEMLSDMSNRLDGEEKEALA